MTFNHIIWTLYFIKQHWAFFMDLQAHFLTMAISLNIHLFIRNLLSIYIYLVVLGIELQAMGLLGKHSNI
jgi:hypothetical protein